MKIWLPNSLYKLKPFVLILSAIMLYLISKNTLILLAASLLFCWSTYILLMRYLWLDSDTIDH